MKITRLTSAVIEANYDWVLVKVDATGGLYGLGEAYMGPAVTSILRELACLVIGADPGSPEVLMRRLRGATVHASPGAVEHAIAGIETAVLDLLGKAYGLPVWKLLGGRYRDRVRVYADCHAGDALESLSPLLQPRAPQWAEGNRALTGGICLRHHGWDPNEREFPTVESYRNRAAEIAARGFTALKFDADIATPHQTDEYNRALRMAEIECVVERLHAVRDAISPQVDLAVDCHWNYAVPDDIRLARTREPLDLLWFEDPVPPTPIEPICEVQQATSLPFATGENHDRVEDFLTLMTEGRVRVLAPDVQKTGPVRPKQIAQFGDLRFTNRAIHNISSPVGLVAAAHVAGSIPNFLALERQGASVPFFDMLCEDPVIQDGYLQLSDRPGLGIEVREDIAFQYRKESEPFLT